ncbi:hypothetical protein [Ruegeria sp. EL01]|jgi:hypothetical protein|uniref:hypothetical protein n=1 Tax=Ruegeria sp. EL01 TaxID=2107578 RepID=UPI0013C4FF29|nr:hypothetical protein [Ruegeria sp. EL01]
MTLTRVLMCVAFAIAAIVFSASIYKGAKRAEGYCIETGQRLSDEESLALARTYAMQSNPLQKDPDYRDVAFSVRLVSHSEVRDEEKVPSWVKRSGGFRAYALVNYDLAGLEKHDLQLLKRGVLSMFPTAVQ